MNTETPLDQIQDSEVSAKELDEVLDANKDLYDKLNQTAQSYSIFGQIYSRFVIDTTYATLVTGRTSTLFIEDPAMICLEPITELRLIGLNGPKFLSFDFD